jgi:hypothetical protein
MNDLSVTKWVAVVAALLVGCGEAPMGNPDGGGSTSNVQASDCTVSATIEEVGTTGNRSGRASGSISCPANAALEISVCIQSSMTMTFTDGMCASGSSSTVTAIARDTEARFAGTRNVRSIVRAKINGVGLPDKTSNVISITP